MKIYFKLFSGIVFITTLFCSCEKTIDFNADQLEPKIVVNALLVVDSKITTSITKSKSLFGDNEVFEVLPNAKADLYVNDQFAETLRFESKPDTLIKYSDYDVITKIAYNKGVYVGETTVEPGKNYRLEVSCGEMHQVSCETSVPLPVEIISVDTCTTDEQTQGYLHHYFTLQIKFKDPADMSNYYRFQLNYIQGFPLNHYVGGQSVDSDTVLLSETALSYYNMTDPIFKTNENEANDIVMGTPENSFTIFDDSQINGNEYSMEIKLNGYSYNNLSAVEDGSFVARRLTLLTLSKGYYDYLNTVNYHLWYSDDYFSEPVQVYSNVLGGLGIFASASTSTYSLIQGTYPMSGKTYIDHQDYYKNQNGYGGYGSSY